MIPLLSLPHVGDKDNAATVHGLRSLRHLADACTAKRRVIARASARSLLAFARLTGGSIGDDARAAARTIVHDYTA